ncbi:MAG: type 4a pilus biogenesis protein PilO [Pseudomonadales bacterium]|nr:type 4a pilus biogenesis protein PilO [Pseudomonadales bacterium]NIX09624.1 type 4a pilus biogenesis protein PilO [Pseudomonadales bacterium]
MAWQDTLEQLRSVDLGDLDLNNMGSWPGAVKGIVMTLLFAAVVAGGYFYYLTDKQELLERAQTKEIGLRGEYESKAAQAANLEAYRQQKQEMEATFGALLRQLPSDTEVPGLLEDITLTALDNELTIESIDLRAENRTEFYVELPIDIVVEGDYHKIGSFVSGVANLSRIVTLHDFAVTPQNSNQDLKMTILAKTYRYLDEEG